MIRPFSVACACRLLASIVIGMAVALGPMAARSAPDHIPVPVADTAASGDTARAHSNVRNGKPEPKALALLLLAWMRSFAVPPVQRSATEALPDD
jgi:hypothetical protein